MKQIQIIIFYQLISLAQLHKDNTRLSYCKDSSAIQGKILNRNQTTKPETAEQFHHLVRKDE